MSYVKVLMDKDEALEMLMARVRVWKEDKDVVNLFEQMYERALEDGVFAGMEFDARQIVDNDVINYCQVIEKGEKDFDKLAVLFKSGNRDVSCEDFEEYRISFIEAVDDEENPKMFLVRC